MDISTIHQRLENGPNNIYRAALDAVEKKKERICAVDGCGRKYKAKGYCAYHDLNMRLHGNVIGNPRRKPKNFIKDGIGYIELSQGKYAIVDVEDFDRISEKTWSCAYFCGLPYAIRSERSIGKTKYTVRMHREIMNAPPGVKVDHKLGNTLDNRKENLRFCDSTGNARNRRSYVKKASRYKGVFRKGNRWTAMIRVNKHLYHLGSFFEEEDAAIYYNVAAQIFHGEFASTNAL